LKITGLLEKAQRVKKNHNVGLQATFGGIHELQIGVIIVHWKYLFVFYTMDPSSIENDQVYPL
jgi:hypothetical protein